MSAIRYAGHGMGVAWRSKRLVLLFFVANLALGLLALRPLDRGLESVLDRNTWSAPLSQEFDFTFLVDFNQHHPDVRPAFSAVTGLAALLYFFVNLFLVGGAIGLFQSPELYRGAAGALAAGGTYFGRMFRLFLWEIPILILLFLGWTALSAVIMGIAGNPPSEATIFYGYIGAFVLLLLLLLLIDMIFDYGKIRSVVEDERRGVRNMAGAMRFVFGHFGGTVGIYAVLFLVGVGFLVIYLFLAGRIGARTSAGLLLLLIVQQFFVLSRVWLKLAFVAGQLGFYRAVTASAAPPQPVPDEPEPGTFA